MDIFAKVPLNTNRVFVRGVTKSGCEVWLPVSTTNDATQAIIRDALQRQLDAQPPYIPPQPPKRFA